MEASETLWTTSALVSSLPLMAWSSAWIIFTVSDLLLCMTFWALIWSNFSMTLVSKSKSWLFSWACPSIFTFRASSDVWWIRFATYCLRRSNCEDMSMETCETKWFLMTDWSFGGDGLRLSYRDRGAVEKYPKKSLSRSLISQSHKFLWDSQETWSLLPWESSGLRFCSGSPSTEKASICLIWKQLPRAFLIQVLGPFIFLYRIE